MVINGLLMLPGSLSSVAATDSDRDYRLVKSFLDQIPQDVLAVASYNCGAHTRALMHHELHVKGSRQSGTALASSGTNIDMFDFLLVRTCRVFVINITIVWFFPYISY